MLGALLTAACSPQAASRGASPKLVVASAEPEPEPEQPEPAPTPERGPAPSLDPIVGHWEGTGVQNDGQTWRMLVEVRTRESGLCATVEYPSVPCSANWICTGRDGDGTLHAREELTSGQSRCIDNGTMTFRLNSTGQLEWSWDGDGANARATLSRGPAD